MFWDDALRNCIGKQVFVVPLQGKPLIEVYVGDSFVCSARELQGKNNGKEGKGGGERAVFGFGGKKIEDYKTEELIKELAKRRNISTIKMKKGQQYKVSGDHSRVKEWGPATVLVVRGIS